MKQLIDRYEKQLQEERSYRQDLEKIFEKRSKELEELTQNYAKAKSSYEQKILEVEQGVERKIKDTSNKFNELALKNNQQREAFNVLSNRYQRLASHYNKTANQLREEQIQLPQTGMF